jgi:hypothetical protein
MPSMDMARKRTLSLSARHRVGLLVDVLSSIGRHRLLELLIPIAQKTCWKSVHESNWLAIEQVGWGWAGLPLFMMTAFIHHCCDFLLGATSVTFSERDAVSVMNSIVSPCLSIQSLLAVRNSLTRWMLDSAIIVGHNV